MCLFIDPTPVSIFGEELGKQLAEERTVVAQVSSDGARHLRRPSEVGKLGMQEFREWQSVKVCAHFHVAPLPSSRADLLSCLQIMSRSARLL